MSPIMICSECKLPVPDSYHSFDKSCKCKDWKKYYKGEKMKIRLFSCFAGVGFDAFALKKAGIDFEVVGISEIDKNAIKIYNLNHPNIKNYGDCTKINTDELPNFDLLTGGFPCQDVSIAGKRDLTKGRTNLYSEILRIASAKKPTYILLENVKGLLSMGKGNPVKERLLIDKIVSDLKSIGYGVSWKCLNSKNYGIPQSRERVWIVCKWAGWNFMEFNFPEPKPLTIFVKDILEPEVNKKYNLSEKQIKFITDAIHLKKGYIQINGKVALTETRKQFSNWNGGPTLCARKRTDESPAVFALRSYPRTGTNDENRTQNPEFRDDGCSNSLTSVEKDNLLVMNCLTEAIGRQGSSKEFLKSSAKVSENSGIFRRLTPRECFRLQGDFNDEIKLDGISDSSLYKLAGNGWSLSPVDLIFKEMFIKEKGNNV